MRRRLVALLPPVAFYALVTIQSSFPTPGSIDLFAYQDKVAHAMIFAVLGALLSRSLFKMELCNFALWRCVVVAGLIGGVLGAADEVHQLCTPQRSAEILDVVADTFGTFVGAFAYGLYSRRAAVARGVDEPVD